MNLRPLFIAVIVVISMLFSFQLYSQKKDSVPLKIIKEYKISDSSIRKIILESSPQVEVDTISPKKFKVIFFINGRINVDSANVAIDEMIQQSKSVWPFRHRKFKMDINGKKVKIQKDSMVITKVAFEISPESFLLRDGKKDNFERFFNKDKGYQFLKIEVFYPEQGLDKKNTKKSGKVVTTNEEDDDNSGGFLPGFFKLITSIFALFGLGVGLRFTLRKLILRKKNN